MTNAENLFYIVNLAVDGLTGIHVSVSGVRQDFTATVRDSVSVCMSIYKNTKLAPLFLAKGYQAAIQNKTKDASKAFNHVSEIAANVVEKAQKLVTLFDNLTKQAE